MKRKRKTARMQVVGGCQCPRPAHWYSDTGDSDSSLEDGEVCASSGDDDSSITYDEGGVTADVTREYGAAIRLPNTAQEQSALMYGSRYSGDVMGDGAVEQAPIQIVQALPAVAAINAPSAAPEDKSPVQGEAQLSRTALMGGGRLLPPRLQFMGHRRHTVGHQEVRR